MKALCVSVGDPTRSQNAWLTVNREYVVLAILAVGRSIEFRVIADDCRTPILADSAHFAATDQPLPESWVSEVTQDGVVELGPRRWLELGFWERFFDSDPDAVGAFRGGVEDMGGVV